MIIPVIYISNSYTTSLLLENSFKKMAITGAIMCGVHRNSNQDVCPNESD